MVNSMRNLWALLIIYLIIINIVGFVIMYADKSKAKRKAYRIPEATLFTVALIGGSIGSILGMQIFRHKTKHWYFVIGMPAILILQAVLAVVLWMHFA